MSTEHDPTTETDCSAGWRDEYAWNGIDPETIVETDETDRYARKHTLGVSS